MSFLVPVKLMQWELYLFFSVFSFGATWALTQEMLHRVLLSKDRYSGGSILELIKTVLLETCQRLRARPDVFHRAAKLQILPMGTLFRNAAGAQFWLELWHPSSAL